MIFARIKSIVMPALLAFILSCITVNLTEELSTSFTVHLMNFARYGNPTLHLADSSGIPMVNYNRVPGGPFYNPVYAGVYALAYHDKLTDQNEFGHFLSKYVLYYPDCGNAKPCWRSKFFDIADWFINNIEMRTYQGIRYGVWTYNFPWEVYDLQSPWISGMAQGLGIQVLVRAWILSGDEKYLATAQLARNSFLVDTRNGGVRVQEGEQSWWYEEYAGVQTSPPFVLNGMEHSLIALHELATLSRDSIAATLFSNGMRSLKSNIKDFDTGWWTYYDKQGLIANNKYHHINITLTSQLYDITGDTTLLVYRKWQQYRMPFLIREFLLQKPNYVDIGLLLLHIIGWLFVVATVKAFLVMIRRR